MNQDVLLEKMKLKYVKEYARITFKKNGISSDPKVKYINFITTNPTSNDEVILFLSNLIRYITDPNVDRVDIFIEFRAVLGETIGLGVYRKEKIATFKYEEVGKKNDRYLATELFGDSWKIDK